MTNDSVNHPSHYNQYEGIEVIDLVEQMNFNKGNAVKYIARAGFKNPDTEIEDLKKAVWYINREIQRLSPKPMIVVPSETTSHINDVTDALLNIANEMVAVTSPSSAVHETPERIHKLATSLRFQANRLSDTPRKVSEVVNIADIKKNNLSNIVIPTNQTIAYMTMRKISIDDLPTICGNRHCNLDWKDPGADFSYHEAGDKFVCYRCGWEAEPKSPVLDNSIPENCPTCNRKWTELGLSHVIRLETDKCVCLYCGSHTDVRMTTNAT